MVTKTKTYKCLRSSVMLLLSIVLCVACTPKELYNSHTDIPVDGWEIQDVQTFAIDIPAQGSYDIDMFVRHNNDYKYRNLWLFVDCIAPDSTVVTDTVNIVLADHYGRWNGAGWGSYYQVEHPLRHTHRLDSGTHIIKITQAMREYKLQGVANVGVKLSACSEDK